MEVNIPVEHTSEVVRQDLQAVQRRRKHALVAGICFAAFVLAATQSRWRVSAPRFYEVIEHAGVFLILLCILGRTWCTLYIGGSKKRTLVTEGPYSVVRNPLYAFTLVGAAGVGAQSGTLTLTFLFPLAIFLIFYVVVQHEEAFLFAAFPDEFSSYMARVPRFWPRLSNWQEADELIVRPHLVRRTLLDACLFLIAVPVLDLIDWLQGQGYMTALLLLP